MGREQTSQSHWNVLTRFSATDPIAARFWLGCKFTEQATLPADLGTPVCSPLRTHCLLSLATSLYRPLLSTPAADFNDLSVEQLARLSAEALRLHLASRYSRTSRPKANMAKRLYDHRPTTL